jgi:hypothetical protein
MTTMRKLLSTALCTLLIASLSLNAAERRKHPRVPSFGAQEQMADANIIGRSNRVSPAEISKLIFMREEDVERILGY